MVEWLGMEDSRKAQFRRAVAALFGTIVGAGIFGLPRIVQLSGYAAGLFWMLLLAGAVALTHLLFAEVVLATPGEHRLVGYVRLYLGRAAARIELVASILGLFGASLAYLILVGLFGAQVLPAPPLVLATLLFLAVAWMTWKGVGFMSRIDFWLSFGLAASFLLLIAYAARDVRLENLAAPSGWADVFLPYGVVLFAYGGLSAVTEMKVMVRGRASDLRRATLWGSFLASGLTILFVTAVVGAFGPGVTEEAVAGMIARYGGIVPMLAAVTGILAAITSYVVFASYLKSQFIHDLGWPKWAAVAAAVGAPYLLYALGVRSFGRILELVGAVLIGLEGLFVALIYLKAKRRYPEKILQLPDALVWLLAVIYAAGAVYEIAYKAL